MKLKKFILPLLIFLASQVSAQNIRDQNFQKAYDEISAMLRGDQPLEFERAVFLTENAYRDNAISYDDFKTKLDVSAEVIKQLIGAIDKDGWRQYVNGTDVAPERELEAKENYRKALTNWAVFTWMTDTVEMRINGRQYHHLPLAYSNDDPFGTTDWRNSQVLNLFESGRGNCYALVTLFKIFSERFHSGANIVTAPQHTYIEHGDANGNRFNVELPTKAFPNMGSIQTLTYTTREGVLNNISMRSLDLKQSVGLCLIYLAKGYQYRYNASNDEFLLTCANTALQYDPKNLNALLLKAQVYEQRVMAGQMTATSYASLLSDLYKLGYRQMPDDMREVILATIQGRQTVPMSAGKTPNPYENIGEESRYVTLSNGRFEEVHEPQEIVRYGRTIFNTEKSEIVKFLDEDISAYKVDPVVFALSVDPLTKSYPELTPYQFASNRPIDCVDIDGREAYWYKLYFDEATNSWKADLVNIKDSWLMTILHDHELVIMTPDHDWINMGGQFSWKAMQEDLQKILKDPADAIARREIFHAQLREEGEQDRKEWEDIWVQGFSTAWGARTRKGTYTSTSSPKMKVTPLDWKAVVPKKGPYKGQSREDHVRLHNKDNSSKPDHGIFKGDGVEITNKAWEKAQALGLTPDETGRLVVPYNNAGTSGGSNGNGTTLHNVTIFVVPGTNNIITSFPSTASPPPPLPKE